MHCAQARNLVALLIGDDIGDSDRPEVERHVAECSGCKAYHAGLIQTQQQLLAVAAEPLVKAPGLWADLQPKVQLASQGRSNKQFNGWAAALAVAATVMAMFAISSDITPVQSANDAPKFSPSASAVGFEAPGQPRRISSDEIDRQELRRLQDLRNETF
ncbi:MAG: anti-sigma factor [Planctomycetaceae bacterium]